MTVTDRPAEVAREERLQYELDPELQKELQKHAGEWVAITRSTLIASGKDPSVVARKAREAGVDSPMMFRVPDHEAAAHYF